MSAGNALTLLGVVVLLSIGQILFKLASRLLPAHLGVDWPTAVSLLTNYYLVMGVALYGVTTLLWVAIIRDVGLSRSYPFMALTMVIVPAASVILFGEQWSTSLVAGGAFIVAGLLIISLGM